MNESIAERVARDFVTKWPSLDATDDEVVADLAPRIQAAIDEAVLAEREACADEARCGNNGHDPSDRIAAAIRTRSVGAAATK